MQCTDYKKGCRVLDSVKFADQGLRETSQETVATGVLSEVVENSTNTSNLQENTLEMKLMCSFIE